MQKWLDEIKGGERKDIILDTDAYNEIDDQYAIAYAMMSPERVNVLAFTAAPFFNENSTSPADGMEKSYHEIFNIRDMVDKGSQIPVYRGSTTYLAAKDAPVESEAARAIVRLVNESKKTVYIVAIGAITNVASAILMDPGIAKKAVVVWLGGHALHHRDNREFNLHQDVSAVQVVFDSGIPIVQIPCVGMCSEFRTTPPEAEYYLKGKNHLCDYFLERLRGYCDRMAGSKVLWDVVAVAALTIPEMLDMVIIPRPIVTDSLYYAIDAARPHYIYVRNIIGRDAIFADLFTRLAAVPR